MGANTGERVCYKHASGIRVEIRRAEALEIEADAAIIGKSPGLRRLLEELTGEFFQEFDNKGHAMGREAKILRANSFRWTNIFSFQYSPRSVRADSLHTYRLSLDIQLLIYNVYKRYKPHRVLILPLAWRNPGIIAVATTQAIANFAYHIASRLEITRCDRWFNRFMSGLNRITFRKHREILEEVRQEEVEHQKKLAELDKGILRPTFYLVDKTDPSPFVSALEGKDPHVRQFLQTWRPSCLGKMPFVRTPCGADPGTDEDV
jgi:hypothetical protein